MSQPKREKKLDCPHCGKVIPAKTIASYLGAKTSEAKAKSSAANGKKGGRPRKDGSKAGS